MDGIRQLISELKPDQRKYLERYFQQAPEWLMNSFRTIRLGKDELLLEEGKSADQIYVLMKGKILAVDYRVRDLAYGFFEFEPVEVFGAMEMICGMETYRTSLLAMENCILLQIKRTNFEQWMEQDMQAYRMQTEKVCRYLLEQARRERLNVLLSGQERIAMVLMRIYEVYGKEHQGKLYLSRKDFSETTGLCDRTVSRVLKDLEQQGYLSREGWSIRIRREQYQKLKKLVESKINGMEEMEL